MLGCPRWSLWIELGLLCIFPGIWSFCAHTATIRLNGKSIKFACHLVRHPNLPVHFHLFWFTPAFSSSLWLASTIIVWFCCGGNIYSFVSGTSLKIFDHTIYCYLSNYMRQEGVLKIEPSLWLAFWDQIQNFDGFPFCTSLKWPLDFNLFRYEAVTLMAK